MSDAEKRQCETYARLFQRDTGKPIVLPPTLYDHLQRNGVAMDNMVRAPYCYAEAR